MGRTALILWFTVMGLLGYSSSSYADDLYLYISGIPGESVADQHADWIDIRSWEWQGSNTGWSNIVGGEALKPIVRPLVVTKYIDKASPLISLAVFNGTHLQSAILHSVQADGDRLTRIQITMQDVIVSFIGFSGSAGESGFESVALSFGQICYRYTPIDQTGAPGESIEKCWDLATNSEPQ